MRLDYLFYIRGRRNYVEKQQYLRANTGWFSIEDHERQRRSNVTGMASHLIPKDRLA